MNLPKGLTDIIDFWTLHGKREQVTESRSFINQYGLLRNLLFPKSETRILVFVTNNINIKSCLQNNLANSKNSQ